MLNSIAIIPSSEDEVTSSSQDLNWGVGSVNSTPAHGSSARTLLLKASSFFTELKRRKVYRVAVAYAVVSWLVIQAASIFLPTFDAPPCIMKAVVVFLASCAVGSASASATRPVLPSWTVYTIFRPSADSAGPYAARQRLPSGSPRVRLVTSLPSGLQR